MSLIVRVSYFLPGGEGLPLLLEPNSGRWWWRSAGHGRTMVFRMMKQVSHHFVYDLGLARNQYVMTAGLCIYRTEFDSTVFVPRTSQAHDTYR